MQSGSRFDGERRERGERGRGKGQEEGKTEKVTSLVIFCSNHSQALLFFLHLSSMKFPCIVDP